MLNKTIFLMILICSTRVEAFNYHEHWELTSNAYEEVCDELNESSEFPAILHKFCNNQIQSCYAHYVAIAGDVLSEYEMFTNESNFSLLKESRFFRQNKTEALDCSNLLELDTSKKIGSRKVKLGGWLARNIRIAINAVNNEKHFMNDSKTAFFALESEINQEQLGNPGISQSLFAKHALAMHYLQDSYSAGHNGVNRIDQHHDYHQAYHDDINHYGIFLKNETNQEWFTYGDRRLNEHIYFIEFAQTVSEESLKKALNKTIENYVQREELRRKNFKIFNFDASISDSEVEKLVQDVNSAKSNSVISIPIVSWTSFFSPCYYADGCNKLEVVKGMAKSNCNDYKVVYSDDTDLKILSCPNSKNRVAHEARKHVRNLFIHLAAVKNSDIESTMSFAKIYFPEAYKTIDSNLSRSGINKVPLLVNYSQEWSFYGEDDPIDVGFTNWGFSLAENLNSDGEGEDGTALYWTIRNPFRLKNEMRNNLGEEGIYSGGRFEGRLELINDDGRFVDNFDFALFSPALRSKSLFQKVFGVYGKAIVGMDDIWEEKSRNIFGGLGVGIDAHFGKNTYFLEFERKYHYHSSSVDYYSSRVFVGWRSTSINLQ